jgi:hypothetical protein
MRTALARPESVVPTLAHEAYVAFVQICKGNSDDAGTYEADEELVRRALKRLDDLEQHHPALTPIPVSERLPREGNFDGKTLLQVNCGNSGELEIALNPRRWTRAHHDAWHRHIPDVHKAFAALLDVAKQRTDPSANALPLPAAPGEEA